MIATALLLGILLGFVVDVLLRAWSDSTDPWKPPLPRGAMGPREDTPHDVLANYRPTAAAIGDQIYLLGLEHGTGAKVTPANVDAVIGAAGRDLERGKELIAECIGIGFVDGARELRDALAQHSGIDDGALDEAVQVALARKASEDGMRKERADASAEHLPE